MWCPGRLTALRFCFETATFQTEYIFHFPKPFVFGPIPSFSQSLLFLLVPPNCDSSLIFTFSSIFSNYYYYYFFDFFYIFPTTNFAQYDSRHFSNRSQFFGKSRSLYKSPVNAFQCCSHLNLIPRGDI